VLADLLRPARTEPDADPVPFPFPVLGAGDPTRFPVSDIPQCANILRCVSFWPM
jgi:hypothetical protein